jgi:hypothetical protein
VVTKVFFIADEQKVLLHFDGIEQIYRFSLKIFQDIFCCPNLQNIKHKTGVVTSARQLLFVEKIVEIDYK